MEAVPAHDKGWNRMIFKVPSIPNHSRTLWIYTNLMVTSSSCISLKPYSSFIASAEKTESVIKFHFSVAYSMQQNWINEILLLLCLKTLLCITFVQLELFYQDFLVSVILRKKWTSADLKFGPPVLQESRSHVATINVAGNELISPGDRRGIFTKFCFPPNHSSKASCRSGVMERGSAETWVLLLSLAFWLILTLIQFSPQVSTINLKLSLSWRKAFHFSWKHMLINKQHKFG